MNTHGATVNRSEIVSMYAGLNVRRAFTSTSSILLTDMLVSRVAYTMSQGH